MEQNDGLFILFTSFTETRDASVRLPKGKKKIYRNPQPKKSGISILKCIDFSVSGLHLLEAQPDQKAKRGGVLLEKTWIFLGGWGVMEGCSQRTAAAGWKLPSIPVLGGKAPGETTPPLVLCSCRTTFSVVVCFTYWQEDKALWLCENPEDLGADSPQTWKPWLRLSVVLQYSDHEHKIKSLLLVIYFERNKPLFFMQIRLT